jgi:hypothetical protein
VSARAIPRTPRIAKLVPRVVVIGAAEHPLDSISSSSEEEEARRFDCGPSASSGADSPSGTSKS